MRCHVKNCRNDHSHNKLRSPSSKIGFFPIPKVISNRCGLTLERSQRRRLAWLSKIKKNGLPESEVKKLRIRSDLFVSGKPCNLHLEENQDWVPSVNLNLSETEETSVGTNSQKPDCQLSRSLEIDSPGSIPVSISPSHAPTSTSTISAVPTPNTKAREGVSSRGRSILRISRQVSPSASASVSSLNSTTSLNSDLHGHPSSRTSISAMSPVKLARRSTPNLKCYQRKARQRSLVSDQSSELKRSGISASENKSSVVVSSVLDSPQDALAEKVYLQKEAYESLKTELEDYKRKYDDICAHGRRLRDQMTELEVDNMELKQKLKFAESAMSDMTKIVNNMEEDFREKEEKRLAEIQRNHVKLLSKLDQDFEGVSKETMAADALTFRKLEVFSSCDMKVKFYTGLPSYRAFNLVLDLVVKKSFPEKTYQKCVTSPWQNLLLTLMRLRLGLLYQDLAYRFGIHVSTVLKNFHVWLDALYHVMCPVPVPWPDSQTLWDTMSNEYQDAYGDSVPLIIECFEIFMDGCLREFHARCVDQRGPKKNKKWYCGSCASLIPSKKERTALKV